MADALYQAAEQLAPSRPSTNFFDPSASQGVISRWANTQTEKQGLDLVDDAQSRIASNRMQRAADRRKLAEWDQDEIEHQDRQAFKAQRGEFLEQIAMIDPTADDYDAQRDMVLKTVPEIALKDDAVQAMLSAKDKRFADRQDFAQREQLQRAGYDLRREQETQRNTLALAKTGLPPEEYVLDADGRIDFPETMVKAVHFNRGVKKEDAKELMTEKAQIRESLAAKGEAAQNRKKVIEANLQDQEAFPTQLMGLVNQYGVGEADLKKDNPKEYQAAKEYDSKRSQSEMASALSRTNMEEYVNLVPGLNDIQKNKRREFWKTAHDMVSGDAPASPSQPEPTAAPSPESPKDRPRGIYEMNGVRKRYLGNGQWEKM